MTDREALTFRITDQSEAAIRSRADQSVLWNEDEGNVPTRIADALWAAVRDRESLLTTLDRERAAGVHLGDQGLRAVAEIVRRHTHHGRYAMTRYAGPDPEDDCHLCRALVAAGVLALDEIGEGTRAALAEEPRVSSW